MERKLAAILAADVVGYTALMGADEDGTLQRLTELRQNTLEPLIAEHRGRLVKLMGDGLLVEFASVVDAVACAIAWQSGVSELEAGADKDKPLQFRIVDQVRGSSISSDDGLLLHWELDDAWGLTDVAANPIADSLFGRNRRHHPRPAQFAHPPRFYDEEWPQC